MGTEGFLHPVCELLKVAVKRRSRVVEKPYVLGLFKNVQMLGAQKPNRKAYIDIH
jgi:hypothetical protein